MLHAQEVDFVVHHTWIYLCVLFTCIHNIYTGTHRIDIYITVRIKYVYFEKRCLHHLGKFLFCLNCNLNVNHLTLLTSQTSEVKATDFCCPLFKAGKGQCW